MSQQEVFTENDEEELIPVDTPPEDEKDPKGDQQDADEDEEEDEGDDRLARSEDDDEEDITSQNRKRRKKRREMQKRAKEAAQRKLELLERQNRELADRLAAIENHAVSRDAHSLEQRLAEVQNQIRQAEHFIAKATEAGNGEDVVEAMRLRDEARAEAQRLNAAKQHFETARTQPPPPQVDPRVVNYAKEWMSANPWYDPQGRDRHSAVTKAIDNELVREGFDPATREYWQELTARVAEAIGDDEDDEEPARRSASQPRKKGPPVGVTREHAPKSTRKEIYVTPERKQAMIDAGVWDDPVQRQRYLKAYQAYDNSAR